MKSTIQSIYSNQLAVLVSAVAALVSAEKEREQECRTLQST